MAVWQRSVFGREGRGEKKEEGNTYCLLLTNG